MTEPSPRDESLLDNPVWHALNGPSSRFAARHSTADLVHFDPEVSVFSAVDRIDEAIWRRIGERVGIDGFCGLFRDVIDSPPSGWEEHFRGPCWQMVADRLPEPSGLEVVRLGPEDRTEMLALAELTEPGPFLLRTPELGRYVGLRREGRLLAMAGERFRLPGYVEISAVCTHPDARGEGLAGELTLNVAHAIRAGGDEAFLHVLESNENATRLYQKLGFVIRRTVDVVFAQWHGPDVP
jgi:ribosomal protein S18 acetylase RimI-like enzyme